MRIPALMLVALLLLLGCGGSRPSSRATAERPDDEDTGHVHPPELLWSPGEDQVIVRGVGVAFRVHAPVARFAIDEVGTDECGDQMVHAMVVDRRESPEIDTILARALMRAGCTIPDEGRIVRSTTLPHEREMVVRFQGGDLDGDWLLRAVVLDRAHRSVAIVSAYRVLGIGAPLPLFEIVDDAPGLESVGAPFDTRPRASPDYAEEIGSVVLGVVRTVGDVLRIFAR